MGHQNLAIVMVIISLATLINAVVLNDLGYSIEKYNESPGIYYESKGVAVVSNYAWRINVYVNLTKTDNETLMFRQDVHHIDMLCQKTSIKNWTGRAHFDADTRQRLNQITRTENLLKEITGQHTGGIRKKREVFNFVGKLSKILFGTMDEDDAKYYEQIKLFEQNSEDMTSLLKQQLYVVKSSLERLIIHSQMSNIIRVC